MAVLPTWRQELFLRSPAEQLRDLAPLLQRHRLASLNLPNKSKGELPALLERCRALRAALPAPVDVCCHYAINHNYHRTADASFAALERFCTDLAAIGTCYSLLLVSGGGPRRKGLDSLSALQRIVISPALRQLRLPLAVAFNPYLPGEEQQAEERRRLRAKLEAGRGLVTAVYLQVCVLEGAAGPAASQPGVKEAIQRGPLGVQCLLRLSNRLPPPTHPCPAGGQRCRSVGCRAAVLEPLTG